MLEHHSRCKDAYAKKRIESHMKHVVGTHKACFRKAAESAEDESTSLVALARGIFEHSGRSTYMHTEYYISSNTCY